MICIYHEEQTRRALGLAAQGPTTEVDVFQDGGAAALRYGALDALGLVL